MSSYWATRNDVLLSLAHDQPLPSPLQVSSTHLLTASVMSAPAALAVAKLFWPETEKPKITLKSAMKMENG